MLSLAIERSQNVSDIGFKHHACLHDLVGDRVNLIHVEHKVEFAYILEAPVQRLYEHLLAPVAHTYIQPTINCFAMLVSKQQCSSTLE